MAYQPKSYRKFLATSVAAAMVATVAAPLAGAEAAKNNFTDVPATAWYAEAVTELAAAGVFSGVGEGKFAPLQTVNRATAFAALSKALNLDEKNAPQHSFTDVPAGHWAEPAVNALAAAGIVKGSEGKVLLTADLTREQLVAMLIRALGIEEEEGLTHGFTDVPAGSTFENAIATAVKHGVTDGLAGTTKFGLGDKANRAQLAGFLYKETVREQLPAWIEYQKEAPATELVVESVSAINGGQLLVKFTGEVDATTAESTGNYTLSDGKTVSTAVVQADGKSVLLTLNTAYSNATTHNVAVTIQNVKVKDTVDTLFPVYTQVIAVRDLTQAEITGVTAVTNTNSVNSITVNFSEPVQSGAAFRVNGLSVNASYLNGASSATVSIPAGLAVGANHKVEVVNLTDMAGNVNAVAAFNFTVTKDDTAPTVKSVAARGDNQLLVTFDKDMKFDATALTTLQNNIKVKDDVYADVTVTGVTRLGTSKTTFVVQLDRTEAATLFTTTKTSHNLTVLFLNNQIEDYLGNKLVGFSTNVSIAKDNVAPEITGVSYKRNSAGQVTSVVVNFSEGVRESGSLALPATMVNQNGVVVNTADVLPTVQTANVLRGATSAEFVLNTATAVVGEFSIAFPSGWVQDTALAYNNSKAFTALVNFGSAPTSGEFTIPTGNVVSTNNVITVTFPEAVKGGAVAGSATDASRYTINGRALPAGTTITLNAAGTPAGSTAQTIATITLPAQTMDVTDAAAIFTINGVQTLTGKTNRAFTKAISVVDNVSPVLQSARVIDNRTIELTYSESIASLNGANVGLEFRLLEGTTAVALTDSELLAYSVPGFPSKVRLQIVKDVVTPAVPGAATVTGAQASKVTLSNQATANATQTVNYTVADNNGTLEVLRGTDFVTALDAQGDGSFTLNGVTVAIAGAVAADVFTVSTTAAVAQVTTAVTLDLTKDLFVETLVPASGVDIRDISSLNNTQKADVRVSIAK